MDAYRSSGTSPTVGEGFARSGSSPTQSDLPASTLLPAVNPPDIRIEDHGSIFLLVPETDAGKAWVNENIGADNGFQPYWPTVVVEPRYVENILQGMMADGLEIA